MKRNFFKDTKKIKGKRFYIVLACCVLSISAIAFTTSLKPPVNTPAENKNENVKYSLPEPIEQKGEEEIHVQPSDEPEQDTVNEKAKPTPSPEYEPPVAETFETSPTLTRLDKPTDGKVLASFSASPAYFEKTGDWRTHEAVDFAVSDNGEIHAAANGKIEKIFSDIYGTTIIIDHENSMKTLYANLEPKSDLKEGESVKSGDIIANAANNSLCEKHDEGFVHFEVIIDGKNIDPNEWLKK